MRELLLKIIKNRKVTTALLVAASATIMIVLAFRVSIGATADSVAVLKTTGMTCGSCAEKITDALKSQKGIAGVEVDVENGWVLVAFDSKKAEAAKFADRVKETGYFSMLSDVVTPEQFRSITGREFGKREIVKGCCGKGGECSSNRKI